jgi:hypothetical protein
MYCLPMSPWMPGRPHWQVPIMTKLFVTVKPTTVLVAVFRR